MIEGHVLPGRGLVTRSTLRSKLAAVCIVIGMAGIAVLRRALIDSVHMTGSALHICMSATQRECGVVVVERHVLPAARVMAGSTICAKLPIVLIIADMTGIAILRGTFQDSIRMASRAGHIGMAASQCEGCRIVIEDDVLPTARVVALRTDCAELTLVGVITYVAGKTILGCAPVDLVHMTGFTRHIRVRAGQLEDRKIMIEFSR